MTASQLKRALQHSGIGHIAAAKKLGLTSYQLRMMLSGASPISDEIACAVRRLPPSKRRAPN
jgi:hypothetical protein